MKNTLATRAAEQAERRALPKLLTGPTALALGFGDEVEAAKSLTDYIRTSRITLPIRGAVLGERVLQMAEVQSLANLPAREVLLAQFMGGLNAPVAGLATVLNALLAGFVRVLDARAKQMGDTGATAASPVTAAPEPEPEAAPEAPAAEEPAAEAASSEEPAAERSAETEPPAEASTEEEPTEPA